MYFTHWIFAIIALTGEQGTGSITRTIPVTQVECEAYLAAHEASMPDYVRGWTKSDPGVQVLVRGSCIEDPSDEDPAP